MAGPCGARAGPGPVRGRRGVRPLCCARRPGRRPAGGARARARRSRRTCWPGGLALDLGRRPRPNGISPRRPGPAGAGRRCPGQRAGWARPCGPTRGPSAPDAGRLPRGLDVLDEHRLTLGASELRAQATAHGAELAALAQRACRAGRADPRLLLPGASAGGPRRWPSPRCGPAADRELDASLAALRSVTRGLDQARSQGTPSASLQNASSGGSRPRCSAAARCEPGGTGRGPAPAFDPAELLAELGASPADRDRRRRRRAARAWSAGGPGAAARRRPAGDASARPADSPASRCAAWPAARCDPAGRWPSWARRGRTCRTRCSARPPRTWATGPVVVVPPGRLHAVPWALLPALRDRACQRRPVRAAPGCGPAARQPPAHRRVALVRGPGLATGRRRGARWSRRLYDDVTVLGTAQRDGRGRAAAPWTAPGSRTSPRTARSGPTARCSPRCGWTTGR